MYGIAGTVNKKIGVIATNKNGKKNEFTLIFIIDFLSLLILKIHLQDRFHMY